MRKGLSCLTLDIRRYVSKSMYMFSDRLPCAVIFDMDGLIFDTERLYQKALLVLAQERGLHSITQDVLNQTVGLSWEGTQKLLDGLLSGLADTAELIDAWACRYEALAATSLELKVGVREILVSLMQRNIPRAVATGSYRKVALHHLAAHGLAHQFNVIVTKEDYRRGKPAPDPFLAAAEQLKVEPICCWALEDSLNGVCSSYDAGMHTIMIPDLVSPDIETRARCSMIAESLNEVVALLNKY